MRPSAIVLESPMKAMDNYRTRGIGTKLPICIIENFIIYTLSAKRIFVQCIFEELLTFLGIVDDLVVKVFAGVDRLR